MIETTILRDSLHYLMSFKKLNFIHTIFVIIIAYLLFLLIDINTSIFAQETNLLENKKQNSDIDFSEVLVGIVGASSAILGGIITSYLTNKGNMKIQIRNDLRNKRIDVYSQLFSLMHKLAILSNSNNLTRDELQEIHVQFTTWYYTQQGGLLMSKHSQQAFIDFQKILKRIVSSPNGQKIKLTDDKKNIANDNYIVKFLGFKLRIALIADVDVNATILLGYSEQKKNNEEAMKAYSKLFVDEKEKKKFEEAMKDYRDYIK